MTDVSRETPSHAPPVPDEARGVFPVERLPLAERYVASLASDGVVRGLIGPRETPRLWTRHVLNSALVAQLVPQGATVADVGTGAGLPGVALAIARPDVRVTLIEPLLRRTTYLEEVIAGLGLDNVVVRRGRAEEMHRIADLAPGFDVVTSRAVAALPRLIEWCLPLVAPRGAMVALKGSAVADEVGDARPVVDRWGAATPEVHLLEAPGVEPTSAAVVRWREPGSCRWPATPQRRSRR